MRALIGVAAVLLIGSAVLAAPNDFEVQASDVPAHPVGQKLEKGAKIVLPEGGKVTLIDRTGGAIRTRECGGKYEGPVEQCKPPGGRGTSKTPGGTRGPTQ